MKEIDSMTLEEAFELAESVHALIVNESSHNINYLTLTCVGMYDHDKRGRWAASFDTILDEDWFEPASIERQRFAARGSTAADAIEQAAKKAIAAFERGELKGSLADYELNPDFAHDLSKGN